MGSLIGWLIAKGIPARLARPLAIGGLVVLILVALAGAKCAYDRNLIRDHDANARADTAEADRKADATAAEERRADDSRILTETREIHEAVKEASSKGLSPRRAYYECVRLQQSARAKGESPADC